MVEAEAAARAASGSACASSGKGQGLGGTQPSVSCQPKPRVARTPFRYKGNSNRLSPSSREISGPRAIPTRLPLPGGPSLELSPGDGTDDRPSRASPELSARKQEDKKLKHGEEKVSC